MQVLAVVQEFPRLKVADEALVRQLRSVHYLHGFETYCAGLHEGGESFGIRF